VLGTSFYNSFLALSQIPNELAAFINGQGFSPWIILISILLGYVVLGCFMDSLSMILLTIPIIFPLVQELDFGLTPEQLAIWFGILVLIVVEMGLITPPVGLILFIINSIDKQTPIVETYKAIIYFIGFDILRVVVLLIFPSISLFLIS